MKKLSILSPAETLFVLQDKNASIDELLKVTFIDLLLKQVVRTFEVQRQASSRDTVRIYKYVETGNKFLTYEPRPHENIFLAPFQKSNSIQILFRNMVKIGYQNAKSESKLHRILRQSPNLNRCFSRNISQLLFGGFNITPDGQELRNNVEAEITQLEKQLPPLILNDHQKALDILKVIKGNIFLLTNIELDSFNQIDKELLSEMNRKYDIKNDGSWSGFVGCTLDSFDNYSHSFDSGGGSGCSSGSDAGCGGNGCGGSGCSGCSGCGGD